MDAEHAKELIRLLSTQIEKRQQALNHKHTKLKTLQKEIDAIQDTINKLTTTRDIIQKHKDVL